MFTANGTIVLGDRLEQCYDGETDDGGLRHGHGVYTYANRAFKYEGHYVKGEKNGMYHCGPNVGATHIACVIVLLRWTRDGSITDRDCPSDCIISPQHQVVSGGCRQGPAHAVRR